MTGTILTIVVILLLAASLEVTHRRSVHTWHPGRDVRRDRDAARLEQELEAAAQDPWTAGEPLHRLAAPRSAETDARLITRAAA